MRNGIIVLLIFLWSCTGKQADNHIETGLDTYLSSFFNPDEPGATVLISKNGQTVFSKSYGLADLKTNDPITNQTLFNLGSISKTFVAYAILMLRNEGKLSLEDPIIKYFPDFKNKEIASAVTIRHLLTHTSGLPDVRKVSEDSVFYLTAKDEENWAPIMEVESLNFNPGEKYEYSNPAFNALALVVQNVSGMKWQKFVVERILKPSGMLMSTITDGPHPESGVAHGYVKVNGEWQEKDYGEEPTFAASGNGGVWSSIDELMSYERALRNAIFIDSLTLEESYSIYKPANWNDESDPFIGLCWFVGETNGLKTIEHTGTQGGFYAHYYRIPEKGILYLVLANRPIDRDEMLEKVWEYLQQSGLLTEQ